MICFHPWPFEVGFCDLVPHCYHDPTSRSNPDQSDLIYNENYNKLNKLIFANQNQSLYTLDNYCKSIAIVMKVIKSYRYRLTTNGDSNKQI